MRKLRLSFIFVLLFAEMCSAQKYWVSFKDKAGVTFDPYSYFSQRTIDQRLQQNLPLCDSTDFPVNPNYLSTISALSDSVSYSSRWLNGLAIYCDMNTAEKISHLPFVADISPMKMQIILSGQTEEASFVFKGIGKKLLQYQTDRLGEKKFSEKKLDGTGIRIAVLDAGFPNVDKNEIFSKLRSEKRIIATYDFVLKKENVYGHHWHGEATLSCIVGIADGINVGMATGAEVLLARTEKASSESITEEENWLAAVEWADKNGANIISSSLGYTSDLYFNNQMNGKRSLIAKAATIAASKGILVVNSAGNEATNFWYTICSPGDADSVLTVGGTDPYTDAHINFSSFGPSSDGRLKPNVCAPGYVMAASGASDLHSAYGTSFSAPLVAGFAACAWQSNRRLTNMELFQAIEKSSHLYPYFDYAHGYGIPQAGYFTDSIHVSIEPTFDFVIINNQLKAVLREKFSHFEDESLLGFQTRRNFYLKTESKEGIIKKFSVLLGEKKEMLVLDMNDYMVGDKISIHFEGYTNSFVIPEDKGNN